ncbi:MAG: M14 family metallopeptidase [Bdellovibrionota bacterium]
MRSRIQTGIISIAFLLGGMGFNQAQSAPKAMKIEAEPGMRWVQVAAKDKFERTRIAETGVSIEAVRTDSVWGFADQGSLKRLRARGFKVMGVFDPALGRNHDDDLKDFPDADSKYHNFDEMLVDLQAVQTANADIASLVSIGKTVEGREMWAIHINTDGEALLSGESAKPGIVFFGAHHAREHLSVEVPLMLAKHLLGNRQDVAISSLLQSRDIWIVPMVNPDGAEYDVSGNKYHMWRKNRRAAGNGGSGSVYGVDLNRNYSKGWGGQGSSGELSSDIYRGPEPFSEPETKAVRDFVNGHPNVKILLSFHTFSELILYPWGHSYDGVPIKRDEEVFSTMAKTMATWNKYKPQQASDLYIASGDTTDWAYDTHKIFAFTFELSPADMWTGGGFYPGDEIIDRVFEANLRPALYLIDLADDPYRAIAGRPTQGLQSYVAPFVSPASRWE